MDIKFENIRKCYGETVVYDGFSLIAESGKVTALLGRSGCGKTTLLNLAAGLVRPDAGTVTAGDCSYVFQTPRLLPNLKARDNLLYVGANPTRADELLRLVEVPNIYPKAMSGGMAQRIGLARAFIAPQPIVLMDEPFKSLDIGLKYRLMDLSKRLIEESGATVLFVTHDPAEAEYLADRAVVLEAGEIVYDRPRENDAFPDLTATLKRL